MILQGLTNGHTFPTKAVRKLRPTHHVTHTKVGTMLKPLCSPTRPAITTRKKSATDSRRRPPTSRREVKNLLRSRIPNRSKRGYRYGESASRSLREKRARGTKASTTAAAAP